MTRLSNKERQEIQTLLEQSEFHLPLTCVRNPYELEYQDLLTMKLRLAIASVIAKTLGICFLDEPLEFTYLLYGFLSYVDLAEHQSFMDEDACLEKCYNLWECFENINGKFLQAVSRSSSWRLRYIHPELDELEELSDMEVMLCKNLLMEMVAYMDAEKILEKKDVHRLRSRFLKLGAEGAPHFPQAETCIGSLLCMYNPVLQEVEAMCERDHRWKQEPEYEEICTYMFEGYPLIRRRFVSEMECGFSSYLNMLMYMVSDVEEHSSLFFLNPETAIKMLLAEIAAQDLLEKAAEMEAKKCC